MVENHSLGSPASRALGARTGLGRRPGGEAGAACPGEAGCTDRGRAVEPVVAPKLGRRLALSVGTPNPPPPQSPDIPASPPPQPPVSLSVVIGECAAATACVSTEAEGGGADDQKHRRHAASVLDGRRSPANRTASITLTAPPIACPDTCFVASLILANL